MKAKTWDEIKTERGSPEGTKEYLNERTSVQFARFIRELRREAALSQVELAERMGVSQPEVARIESGVSLPTVGTLLRIGEALDRSVVVGTVRGRARQMVIRLRLEKPQEAGQIVLELRRETGLTQEELARRMGVGQPNVARLEEGTTVPMVNTLARAAHAVGQSLVVVFAVGTGLGGGRGQRVTL